MSSRGSPGPVRERIEALDVLRGFALLGIFVMNMQGFAHSLFTPPEALASSPFDRVVLELRELLFAGKFNLLFGALFGIGFTLQLRRLEAADPSRATSIYVRRLVALLGIGLVHVLVLWSGDVLVIYALIGFALLALRRLPERAVLGLLMLCLVFPAAWQLGRPWLLTFEAETFAAFGYQAFEAADNAAFGHGTFIDAARQTMRIFVWGYTSALGLYSYIAFYAQMATGILLGYLIGRRGWVERLTELGVPLARLHRRCIAVVLVCGLVWTLLAFSAAEISSPAAVLARTIARIALTGIYALGLLRLLRNVRWARLLHPLALAGRMPLSNYLLQTALGTCVFYGWGFGFWSRTTPAQEVLMAILLFMLVQLPLSAWWLSRFRQGPMEALWRRLTYGSTT